MLLALNPVVGDHVYEVPPVACNCVEAVLQIETSEPALAFVPTGFTVTVCVAVAVQPLFVMVTVYAVVVAGAAIGLAILGSLKPVAGNHENVHVPVALNEVVEPKQMVGLEPTFTDAELMVTVEEPVEVQPLLFTTTEYVPVAETVVLCVVALLLHK